MRRLYPLAILLVILLAASVPAAHAGDDTAPADELAQIEAQLHDGDTDERVRASKWLRGHGATLDDEAAARILALLEANLQHDDPEVRKWTVLALATRGDEALPILEAALPREDDDRVRNQLQATIRHTKEAIAQREWIENHPCREIDRDELLTWEVRELCDPLGKYPPVLFELGDGTQIYGSRHRADDECFRGKRKKPCTKKCMPEGTPIATPTGAVPIETLELGDLVWSVDADGARVAAPVVALDAVEVRDHELVELTLVDGRVVAASAYHPTASGTTFGELRVGDEVDGATVVRIEQVAYDGTHTRDILPESATGDYFAAGVRIGSTLAPAGVTTRR